MSMRVQDFVGVRASQSEVESALAMTQGYKNAAKNRDKGSLQTLFPTSGRMGRTSYYCSPFTTEG